MIPKKIHYCWIGGNPLPPLAHKCIKSWKKYCPDYEIIEWNETNYDFTKIPYMKEAFDAKKWGFVPDYARLDIIYQYGGIYLDTDVELLKPIDDLLELKGFAGFEGTNYVALGLGFGAEAGNNTIEQLMKSYNELSFLNSDGTYNLIPSPQLNTAVLRSLGLVQNNTLQTVGEMTIYPSDFFCPRVGYGGKRHLTKNTYSDHHFDASWADEEDKKKWANYNQELDKRLRREKITELRFLPNRIGMRILGKHYETLKKILKNKR